MDDATLRIEVENQIQDLIGKSEAFTTADISHPIINKDESVRHKQVKAIVDEMDTAGNFHVAGYIRGSTTIYLQGDPSKPMNVRLWYPDNGNFDPDSYSRTSQKLSRSGDSQSSPSRGIDMTDDDDDDADPVVTNTVDGHAVTKQCSIQQRNDTLNIPLLLIKDAGFNSGDAFSVVQSSNRITVHKSAAGKQNVDAQGRIRIHGANIAAVKKADGSTCKALVATNGSEKYIEIS